MKFMNLGSRQKASDYVAVELFKDIHFTDKPVLGLATGGTMEDVYLELVELVKENHVDMSKLTTFNLDEYYMLDQENENSYMSYMKTHFFDKVGMNADQYHIPYNKEENSEAEIAKYEEALRANGKLDVQLLGIGENGHIGFNEPGTSFDAKTRLVDLTDSTIEANARYFDSKEEVPTKAVTMGIDSIMHSEKVILVALGEKKADIMAKLYDMKTPDEEVPASVLLNHPNVEIIMDDLAAAKINWK